MTISVPNPEAVRALRPELQATQRRFFVGMAAVLLAIVLLGFSPTFYLRAYLATPDLPQGVGALPVYLNLHGVILTAWFLLFFAQTALVASHRVDIHRRLGVATAVLAAAVVVIAMLVIVRAVPRSPANGIPAFALPLVVIGDIAGLIQFSLLVAGGILFRRRPDTHKRLMLLASVSIVGPAIARLPWPDAFRPFAPALGLLVLLAAVIGHDLFKNGRVHRATIWGELLILLTTLAGVGVGFSDFGTALVHSLSREAP